MRKERRAASSPRINPGEKRKGIDMIIRYRIVGEGLLPQTEDSGTYDEEASLRKFVELCREAIIVFKDGTRIAWDEKDKLWKVEG